MSRKYTTFSSNKTIRLAVSFLLISGIVLGSSLWRSEFVSAFQVSGHDQGQERPDAIIQFGNISTITINDSATPPTIASPYPSQITVSGLTANPTKVTVDLGGLTHTFPDDVDIILEGPTGARSMLMSDAGAGVDVSGLILSFSQTAAAALPDAALITSGTYLPTNHATDSTTDTFPGAGPGALVNAPANLDVFNGLNANGIWKLYVVDDAGTDAGSIGSGWSLNFTVVSTLTVTKTADTNDGTCNADCSLREAIAAATSGDTITFSPLFNSAQTITLGGTQLAISKNLTINGPGANLLMISGNNASRVFSISSGITASLSGITITGGIASGGDGDDEGGGISNKGTLTVTNSTISGNTATGLGGGISSNGTLTVTNSTISGNTATIGGGGIFNFGGRTLTVTNSTISGNTATNIGSGRGGGIENLGDLTVNNSTISGNSVPNGDNNGGGIQTNIANASITNSTITNNSAAGAASASGLYRNGGTVTIRNSIIAAGVNNVTQPDVAAVGNAGITSTGFNLIGNRGAITFAGTGDQSGTGGSPLNPLLGSLANNGGPTQTHALLGGSPALDRGSNSGSPLPTTDQRGAGFARIVDLGIQNASGGDGTDIGAFESATIPPCSLSSTPIAVGGTANGTLQIGDCHYTDGSYYDAYTFTGTAGQQIAISMNSGAFNAFLFLVQGSYPGGTTLVQDNDGGGGTNARIPATSGFFSLPANGTYTILANSFAVGETGAYTLTLTQQVADTTAPTASGTAPNVTTAGATSHTATVVYTDNVAINVSTVGIGDIRITGPNGFDQPTDFQNVTPGGNGTPRTANYPFPVPGGWTPAKNGDYNIVMQANQVADTSGNFVAAGTIGTFTVNIAAPVVVVDGAGGNDTLVITATSANTGSYTLNGGSAIPLVGVTSFTFNGLGGDDTFTINNQAGGLFAPSGGIDFNGGGQPGDNMNLLGGGGPGFNETYFVGTTTPPIGGGSGNNGSGLVRFTGPNPVDIRFTGLAPIVDTVTAGFLTVNATDAANTISVTNASVVPRLRVAVDAFEPIDFDNKINVEVNGGDGTAGGDSADTITVNYSNTPGALNDLSIIGDEGNDVITALARSGAYALSLYGADNDDQINAAATVAGPGSININGGNGDDALIGGGDNDSFDGGSGNDRFIGNGGTDNIGAGAGTSIDDRILMPGTAGVDTITLAVDGSGFLLATTNGVTTTYRNFLGGSMATSGVEAVDITGGSADDTISVTPQTNIAINIDGGSPVLPTQPGDTLTVNLAGVTGQSFTPSSPGAGVVTFTNRSTVTYTSIETSPFVVPTTFTVINLNDSGPGSLRQAILNANANSPAADTINFQAGLTGTIPLTSDQLSITDSVTINGPGLSVISVSGNNARRVFETDGGTTVSISGLTITNGSVNGDGGGIRAFGTLNLSNCAVNNNTATGFSGGIDTSVSLTVTNCTISGNTAANGGGIASAGTVNVIGSTITGNTATFSGGGVNFQLGNSTITNSTISGNTANSLNLAGAGVYFQGDGNSRTLQISNSTIANNISGTASTGGGVFVGSVAPGAPATMLLRNNIIAGNSAPNLLTFVEGGGTATITSQGFNLTNDPTNAFLNQSTDQFNTNPLLGPLANNGGPTQTHALLVGSPAVDKGSNAGSGQTTDQRGAGFTRTIDLAGITNAGDGTDIGAFEAQTAPAAPPTISITDVSNNEGNSGLTPFAFNITLSAPSAQTITVTINTADGTATAPSDYTTPIIGNTFTFNPGVTSRTATIQVNGDTTPEPNETFFVNLSNPTNATIADGQGLGTIINDDAAPTPTPTPTPTVTPTPIPTPTATPTPTPTPTPAPSSIVVINTNDGGPGSLRQAIADVADGGTIAFSSLFSGPEQINEPDAPQTITLTSGTLVINKAVTISGTGANLLTVSGNNATRVFTITSGPGVVNISGMTITGGNAIGGNPAGFGGGINSERELNLTDVHFTNNRAGLGGGAVFLFSRNGVFSGCTFSNNTADSQAGAINYEANSGTTLRIINSTFSGNNGGGFGGAILNQGSGTNSIVEITNSTIANNTATNLGGGILTSAPTGNTSTTRLRSTILANNTPTNLATGLLGGTNVYTSQGYNLSSDSGGGFLNGIADQVNTNPLLAPLQNNGGTTPTHSLLAGSPAIDGGNSSGSFNDQRGPGFLRVIDLLVPNASGGDGADIGAFELQSEPPPATVTISGVVRRPSGSAISNTRVFLNDAQGNRVALATTSGFGIYTFSNVASGQTYFLTVSSKRYRFAPQSVTPTGNITGLDLLGLE